MNKEKKKLFFILGPTGVGKTTTCFSWARKLDAGIMNADSLQVFQYLDIGTAKPSPEEREKIPHFLFDFIPPPQTYSAGKYLKDALEVIEHYEKKILFVVGGSGFYLQALEKGMPEILKVPEEVSRKIRKKMDEKGLEDAYKELKEKDSKYAKKIHPHDKYRLFRALCLIDSFKKPIDEIYKLKNHKRDFEIIKIGLKKNKEDLMKDLEKRVLSMLDRGLIEEVQSLVRKGYKEWPALKSVGYKQVVSYLEGQISSKEDLREEILKGTKHLVKKQMTWFQRDKKIQWFAPSDPLVMDYIKKFL